MPYSTIELESFVQIRAPEIARDIRKAADKAHNEADLVAEVEKVLERFAKNFDVNLNLSRERTLINGRADAVYNRLVIEYEPPHSLHKTNEYQSNKHAIQQVKDYMDGLERLDRQRKERLAGVVLDGFFFIFIRYRDNRWFVDDPLPVGEHSTETFLRYLISLSTETALTPENLVRDFGENSNTARHVVPVLYTAICTTESPKAQILFEQWQRQFQEISGYDSASGQLDVVRLARMYAVNDRAPDLEKLFFAIHTYYATFIKLLALQVANFYLMPKMGSGLNQVADHPSDKLCSWLQNLERGGLFTTLGIKNFLEGDFFGWYLDIWGDSIDAAVRRIISELANYSLVTLDVDPEETRDLLKQLYQNLVPKELRHALGEYYTPDWLAERLLNQLGYTGDPRKRVLDPACGSGTFLVLALKRVRQKTEEDLLNPGEVLEMVLNNVVGYDLNPLAVISARTNYLLALGDLLEHRKGDITIPVYMCDSILTPTQGNDLFSQMGYSFNTAVGEFILPRSLIQANFIDQLADLLEECVHLNVPDGVFIKRLIKLFPLDEHQDTADIDVLLILYHKLLQLEEQEINGIWARIIKNAFAPLFQPKFDFIAGNPPWVNWESLPRDYRSDTRTLWEFHGLFPHSGMDTILGKGKKDISMLMTYVAMDNYLSPKGKLGFVITQSVLKTIGAGQGFRRFVLGSGTPIRVISVDDMTEIKPFEGAANRTAILIMDKGRKMEYPLRSYALWYKPSGGSTVPEDITLDELSRDKLVTFRVFIAKPIDSKDETTAWITGKEHALHAVEKIIGQSDYQANAGVCTWLNGVYWLEILNKRQDGILVVRNITEGTKIRVDNIQAAIEPNLIYPLLNGRDVVRWQASPRIYTLMVQDPDRRRGYDENWLQIQYPLTYAYLKYFENELRKRSGYKRYFRDTDPFYSVFNVGNYTFAPYKVVWARIANSLACAVVSEIDGKCVIPQNIVTLVATDNRDEAHYICAMLNSSMCNYALQSYSQKGGKSFGTPQVLENLKVPAFIANDQVHQKLALLSQQAHEATLLGQNEQVTLIEAEIDMLAANVWGLTDKELLEVQESLNELI